MEQDEMTRLDVLRRLDRFLTREHDRRLFALPDNAPDISTGASVN